MSFQQNTNVECLKQSGIELADISKDNYCLPYAALTNAPFVHRARQ